VDTREKILPVEKLASLLRNGEWIIAVGEFDPLTAAQAKRLNTLKAQGGKLMALILESDHSLLPAPARALLIAALRDVDAVAVAAPESWRLSLPSEGNARIIEDTDAEQARSAEFVRFVVERQTAGLNGTSGL
jgi:hypothetical protein